MVSPVEQAAATAFFNGVFGWIILELQKNYRLWRKVWQECKSLEKELLMLASAMDDELRNSRTNGAPPRRATARAFSEEMRELTHDIEDCIERFLPRLACKEEVSWPGRYAHTVKTSHTRLKFAKEIKKLHARSKEARQRIFTPPTAAATTTAAATPEPEPALPDNPVGISEAKVKLRSLLLDTEASNRSGPDPAQLTVVVIVGFGGSGKTTLARAVFDSLGGDTEFPSRAWVSMSLLERRDAHGVRQEIHKQLRPGQEYSENSLTDHLKAKGYLVVIDDIKIEHMEHWDHIRKIFKGKGKIIVTTAVQSVANRCSSSGENNGVKYFGYVYKMRAFGKEDSRLIALQGRCTTEILENSANLLKKCDGLPLALASVARQLDSEDEPTGQFCSKLCSDLGSYLHREDDEEPNFARLRGVLMDNYTSLSNYTVRTCLLYLSIFPANRPIRRNVIIRRWMAEGYARSDTLDGEKIADGNFRTFLDRNIIHAGPSQNATAKKCKTPGILHEFMLHKSMSKKFIMPFGANKQKKVRHLFIHNNNDTDSRMTLKTDLSCVRSLTVLGNAGVAISDFRKYKLIRVLDLEECTDVNDGHLMDICKLYNLRYLSLGHSINTVPKEIGQLKLLETLVLSKTRENVLPIEAIGLPCLIHLVGKFKFQDPVNRQQLPTEPKMKMLTGFIADGSEGFLQLIEHMKELNKIKIWCKSVDVEADHFPAQRIAQMNNGLTDAIQKYIEAPITMGGCRALSIDFQALPDGYLHALGDLCNHSVQTGRMYYLSSLKLYGNTSSLPEFVRLFRNLSELCLSTNLTQEFFSALGEMTCLLYLKLIADRFDSFTIQAEKFKSLRRMCFEFNRTNPALLTISCGALPELTSLQLICEHLVDLCVIELRWINQLKEIVLHPDVSEQTINKWETAAMDHPNRPNVFPHRKSDDPRNEPAPDQTSSRLPAVATEALGRSSMSSGHMNSTSDKSGFPVRVKRSRRPRLLSFLARRRSTYENSKNFGKY